MMRVIALAGRRIDAVDAAESRFPLSHAPVVQERLRALFVARHVSALVCSAACGADLLALEVAGSLGLRCRVVLPFERRRFRDTSVTDRQGDWGPRFDRVIDTVAVRRDLVVLEATGDSDTAYAAVNEAILDHAHQLAGSRDDARSVPEHDILAVVVWDGKSRGEGDLTAKFAAAARARGIAVEAIPTL
jgi:hypothetical protein